MKEIKKAQENHLRDNSLTTKKIDLTEKEYSVELIRDAKRRFKYILNNKKSNKNINHVMIDVNSLDYDTTDLNINQPSKSTFQNMIFTEYDLNQIQASNNNIKNKQLFENIFNKVSRQNKPLMNNLINQVPDSHNDSKNPFAASSKQIGLLHKGVNNKPHNMKGQNKFSEFYITKVYDSRLASAYVSKLNGDVDEKVNEDYVQNIDTIKQVSTKTPGNIIDSGNQLLYKFDRNSSNNNHIHLDYIVKKSETKLLNKNTKISKYIENELNSVHYKKKAKQQILFDYKGISKDFNIKDRKMKPLSKIVSSQGELYVNKSPGEQKFHGINTTSLDQAALTNIQSKIETKFGGSFLNPVSQLKNSQSKNLVVTDNRSQKSTIYNRNSSPGSVIPSPVNINSDTSNKKVLQKVLLFPKIKKNSNTTEKWINSSVSSNKLDAHFFNQKIDTNFSNIQWDKVNNQEKSDKYQLLKNNSDLTITEKRNSGFVQILKKNKSHLKMTQNTDLITMHKKNSYSNLMANELIENNISKNTNLKDAKYGVDYTNSLRSLTKNYRGISNSFISLGKKINATKK